MIGVSGPIVLSGDPDHKPDDLHQVVYSEIKPSMEGSQATDSPDATQGT